MHILRYFSFTLSFLRLLYISFLCGMNSLLSLKKNLSNFNKSFFQHNLLLCEQRHRGVLFKLILKPYSSFHITIVFLEHMLCYREKHVKYLAVK